MALPGSSEMDALAHTLAAATLQPGASIAPVDAVAARTAESALCSSTAQDGDGGQGGGGGGGGGNKSGAGGGRSREGRGGGGGGGGGGSHSAWLCPLLGAVADALFGGTERATSGPYAYAKVRARAMAGGFLWDALVQGYAVDFAARGLTLAHLEFDARGHTRGLQQEVLLFPPDSPFSFRNVGRSRIPEEAFMHLLLFVTQERGKAPLDPSAEGLEAARAALAAFAPPSLAMPEPLPAPPPPAGGGGKRGGGRGGRGGRGGGSGAAHPEHRGGGRA